MDRLVDDEVLRALTMAVDAEVDADNRVLRVHHGAQVPRIFKNLLAPGRLLYGDEFNHHVQVLWRDAAVLARRLDWVSTGVLPLGDQRGELHYVHGLLFRHRQEPEVLCLRAQPLETPQGVSERAIPDLGMSGDVAHIAHDLRTPLQGIQGMAELLQSEELSHRAQGHLRSLMHASDCMERMLGDLVEVARQEHQVLSHRPRVVAVRSLLEHYVSLFNARWKSSQQSVLLRVHPEVPPYLELDPQRVQQLLDNLLSNAAKFSRGDAITISMSLAPQPASRRYGSPVLACLKVVDRGVGIPRDSLPHIFRPFSRAHRKGVHNEAGYGLGMGGCRRLAEAMGGSFLLSSAEGQGTMAKLVIPSRILDEESCITRQAVARGGHLQGLRVLVVEDDLTSRLVLQGYCHRLGCAVTTLVDCRSALGYVASAEPAPEVIIMDRYLPDGDGLELLGALRAQAAESSQGLPPCVLMSGDAQSADSRYARARGFHAALAKPVPLERLRSVLLSLALELE